MLRFLQIRAGIKLAMIQLCLSRTSYSQLGFVITHYLLAMTFIEGHHKVGHNPIHIREKKKTIIYPPAKEDILRILIKPGWEASKSLNVLVNVHGY